MRALVIGASKGIGAGIAGRLSNEGHTVVSMSRSVSPWLPWYPLDLASKPDDIDEALESALAELEGHVDLLVMSAGMGAMHTPFEEDMRRAAEIMRVNYLGPVQVFHRCLRPLMRARSESHLGRAMFIGSTCASRPSRGMSLYRASKAALHAFALNKKHELKGRVGIDVIAPGWVDTPMTAEIKPELQKRICEIIPAGRFATVDEVVRYAFAHQGLPGLQEMTEFTTKE